MIILFSKAERATIGFIVEPGEYKPDTVLLISGFRDIPHMWDNYANYLNENKIAYYAPRTCGNGRSFFQQKVKWQDWVLTYFEAIILLSKTSGKKS